MAIGIQNYNGQVTPPDSDYPHGNIKDNTGANDGTFIDVKSNGDLQQTLTKFLLLADLVPNGLPDNEYNGYQYITAMNYMLGNFRRTQFLNTTNAGIIAEGDYSPIVIVKPECGNLCFVTLAPSVGYAGKVLVVNYSQFSVDLQVTSGETINSAPAPFILGAGDSVEILYDSGPTNWVITSYNKLDI